LYLTTTGGMKKARSFDRAVFIWRGYVDALQTGAIELKNNPAFMSLLAENSFLKIIPSCSETKLL